MPEPLILATSGGFQPDRNVFQWRMGPLVRHALSLTGKERPRLCWVGTAQGDSPNGIQGFYTACSGEPVEASHLQLFSMPNVDDVAAHILRQDVIWVGGGSVANLLAVWRVHHLDEIFHDAWTRGIVLAGVSAGSICWHVGGTTDSFGPDLRPVTNGLGFVPFSNGVHYDSEEKRRPTFHRLIADEVLPAGYATDDGVGVLYRGTEFAEALAEREGPLAYVVRRRPDGSVQEDALAPTLLSC